jgi:hypothetical protein
VDPKRYKVELENDQVRVFRVRYGPHDKGVMHEHTLNRVVTFITDGNMKVTTPDGESKILKTAAGDVTWGGPAKHTKRTSATNLRSGGGRIQAVASILHEYPTAVSTWVGFSGSDVLNGVGRQHCFILAVG